MVRYATDYLLTAARLDTTILNHVLRVRDIEESVKQLEEEQTKDRHCILPDGLGICYN